LQLLNSLEAGPHKDNTLVVLWTDHGWHLGEKLGWRKFKLWERATKVPLIFAGPGVARGAKNNSIVSLMDIRPTLADLSLGRSVTSQFGNSLREHLKDPAKDLNRPVVTAWGKADDRHVTVRSDRWRYILYSDGTEELYDHDVDPKEQVNLLAGAASRRLLQDVVRQLRTVIGR
jgi:arylsulfatase A-like enzyme